MSQVLDLFLETRWALDQTVLMQLREVVFRHAEGAKLGGDEIDAAIAAATAPAALTDERPEDPRVAVIPVQGVISRYSSSVGRISQPRGTSVQSIREQLQAALEDDTVETIVFDINSPGGSALGVAELADDIRALRGRKRMVAQVEGLMASAAYWIGAQADEIRATRGSEIGSIGVYAIVDDYRPFYRERGIDTKVVRSSPLKGVGVQGAAIDEAHLAEIQRGVQATYDMFVQAVAQGRGLDEETARQLADGRVHMAEEAQRMGLIDQVSSFAETWGALTGARGDSSSGMARAHSHEGDMTTKKQGQTEPPAPEAQGAATSASSGEVFDIAAEMERARTAGHEAGVRDGREAGLEEGRSAGATEERKRCSRILRAATASQTQLATRLVAEGVELDDALDQLAADPRRNAHAALVDRAAAAPDAIDGSTVPTDESANHDPDAEAKKAFEADPDKDCFDSFDAWKAYKAAATSGQIMTTQRGG